MLTLGFIAKNCCGPRTKAVTGYRRHFLNIWLCNWILSTSEAPCSYVSNSLVLLWMRCCAAACINASHIFFLLEKVERFTEEGDGSGNSCTIGSEIYLDVSYLHYLYDARLSISSCLRACRVWSAPYDGEDPPPEKYQPGVLEEPGAKGRLSHVALKRAARAPVTEPSSVAQLELEWDDSYDACPVQTHEAAGELGPPPLAPAEPPKHIQDMRRTAIMLVKGSYVEENEFQDDVMVYDLVARKDVGDGEHRKLKPSRSESEPQAGSTDVPQENGLSLTLPTSAEAAGDQRGLDAKVKGQADSNSNLQKATARAEAGDDLLAQYEELIRTLDREAGGKAAKADVESRNPVASATEEEDEDGMDFTSPAETPEPDKLHSPFGARTRSGSSTKNHSLPFTGEPAAKRVTFHSEAA